VQAVESRFQSSPQKKQKSDLLQEEQETLEDSTEPEIQALQSGHFFFPSRRILAAVKVSSRDLVSSASSSQIF
jgi:hypothetical protein